VSDEDTIRKHALECLRLRADCLQLASEAATPELREHFLAQAAVWADLAERGPGVIHIIAADLDAEA
jgi:hypothetical protein